MILAPTIYITLQLGVVAWFDFKTKKISNIWPLVNLLLFILLPFLWPESYQHQLNVWFVPLAFLFVGFILFKMDIMGAGDSKYLFSLFLLIPQFLHEDLLTYLLIVTVSVGGTLLAWKMIRKWDEFKAALVLKEGRLRRLVGGKFTYAPVILAAWLWFLIETGIRQQ